MSEWISVEERTPEATEWCLVVDDDGCMNCAAWHKGQWYDWTDAPGYNVDLGGITHWQPLPEPPK